MVSYFGVYELLGQFVYRIYSNNIDFYHVKGDFTEVHFLWFFLGLCSSSSKNDHFRSNFKSTIGGSAKHQIEFQKNTRIVGHVVILVHFSAHSNLNSSEILLKHTVGKKMGKWYNLLLNYLKSFLNFH